MNLKYVRAWRMFVVFTSVAPVVIRYIYLFKFRVEQQVKWDSAHEFAANRVASIALRLGGVFIKLPQVLASRRDVLPEPYIRILSRFHDRVPARDLQNLLPHLSEYLSRPWQDVFETIDEKPLGAASLAQVHHAKLADGQEVVAKIQYPEVRRLFPTDIKTVRIVARIVQRFPIHFDFVGLVDEIARFIGLELDFTREAQSTQRVAKNMKDVDELVVPEIFPEFSSDRLLVESFVSGIQVTHLEALKDAGHELPDIAQKIARIYAKMIFEDGFFHGDPHPGNILVQADGKIVLLDFGLAKELPAGFAAGVAKMLTGGMSSQYEMALRAAQEVGFVFEKTEPEVVGQMVRSLLGDFSKRQDGKFMDILAQMPVKTVPPDFPLIVRTLVLLNGLSYTLAPGQMVLQRELLQKIGKLV